MKKWSICLLAAAAFAAFALPAASSAAGAGTYCPEGQTGTPPYCTPKPPPPVTTCAAGQVGTYPNCVTPSLSVKGFKRAPRSGILTLAVNAPGRVKVSGKGLKTKSVAAAPGTVKIKLSLTRAETKLVKARGKVRLKVKVTYSPNGGSPIAKTVSLIIKAR